MPELLLTKHLFFAVEVTAGAAQLQLCECSILNAHVSMAIGDPSTIMEKSSSHITVLHFQLSSSILNSTRIICRLHSSFSFLTLLVSDNIFTGSVVYKDTLGGFVAALFENCHFREHYNERDNGIYFNDLAFLAVQNCTIELSNKACLYGCGVYAAASELLHRSQDVPELAELVEMFLCFESRCLVSDTVVHIENSQFQGSVLSAGSVVYCRDTTLVIHQSWFRMTTLSVQGQIIHFATVRSISTFIKISNVIFDAGATKTTSVLKIGSDRLVMENVLILCSKSFTAHKVQGSQFTLYSCQNACKANYYTLQSGNMTSYGHQEHYFSNLSDNASRQTCFPVGANCSQGIVSLPNYWGYKNQHELVTMLRCPDGYCCSDNATCEGINSCNTRRTGNLCGICETHWAESLFSTECIPVEQCFGLVVVALYSCLAAFYALVLLMTNTLKDRILNNVKLTCKEFKHKLQSGRKEQTLPECETTTQNKDTDKQGDILSRSECSKDDETQLTQEKRRKEQDSAAKEVHKEGKDSAMKYVQILFYYVQDVKLFQVHLPTTGQQAEGILLKVLQFSPDILVAFYTKVSQVCFGHRTSPVSKVLFKSLFGPYVMCFLLLIFLVQKVLSVCVHPSSSLWKSLKTGLLQTFLVTFLFSYQQIVTGVFTLVQCVEVNDHKVLLVQGNIECFTWWQICVQIYTYMGIIPALLILSTAPYYIQDKTMSVQMFILACCFPVPVMVYFVGCKAIQSSCLHKSKFTQENGIELPETGLPESHKVLTTEPSPGLHVEPIPLIDDASEEDDSYSITCGPVSTQSNLHLHGHYSCITYIVNCSLLYTRQNYVSADVHPGLLLSCASDGVFCGL